MRIAYLVFILCGSALAQGASDATVDWLLQGEAPTTRPSVMPATQPATARATEGASTQPAREGARHGIITLSNGEKVEGEIATTPGKPLRIWQEKLGKYADIPLAAVGRLDAVVLWEREEKEWHFIASGSDLKEYTGRTYPARETAYRVRVGESTIEGGVVAPLYVQTSEGERTLLLHKRDKGPMGAALKDLVYVKSIEFGG